MTEVDLLIHDAALLLPLDDGDGGALPGGAMDALRVVENGAVAVRDGLIAAVGETPALAGATRLRDGGVDVDASGATVMPAFVDPHTHVVFAGSREWEFEERLRGKSYMEIARAGGGIRSSVRAFRQASDEEILRQSRRRVERMLGLGTAVVEVKSGYGLDAEQELRALRLIRELGRQVPAEIHATFLGAHEIPDGYRDRPDRYVDLVVEEMIPRVAEEGLATFCDVFCEEGVFSVAQSEKILTAARRHGLRPKLHADELSSLGGAELAARVGAVSADHLLYPSDAGLQAMQAAGVVPVLLPATSYSLGSATYAPARKMIALGLPVSLATDCNPGSSMTESMPLAISLACLQMGLTPAEAVAAATRNAAAALDLAGEVGRLAPGYRAHIQILDAPSYSTLPYHVGVSHVRDLFVAGRGVIRDGRAASTGCSS
ncbi:MAG: imidazolonepropionase [Candidatus Eisenbacteria bacterium]|nr:imidazolonepropionase [Candidatus Eisenbacteria bacterium]